jgi:hypothetical protein
MFCAFALLYLALLAASFSSARGRHGGLGRGQALFSLFWSSGVVSAA